MNGWMMTTSPLCGEGVGAGLEEQGGEPKGGGNQREPEKESLILTLRETGKVGEEIESEVAALTNPESIPGDP